MHGKLRSRVGRKSAVPSHGHAALSTEAGRHEPRPTPGWREAPRCFADARIGAVVHDGPLHKDPVRCEQYSDCGFDTRFLPRLGAEIGYRLSPWSSIGLFYDHMSHKRVVEGGNEGLDPIGVR